MKLKSSSLAPFAIIASASSWTSFSRADDNNNNNDADYVVMGSCVFTNPWSGESCMEFRDDTWTDDSMKARCDVEADAVVTSGEGCAFEDGSTLAGWCVKTVDGLTEASALMISTMADCDMNSMACETFVQGTFEPNVDACSGNDNDSKGEPSSTEASTESSSSEASSTSCDESMTSPTATSCPKEATMKVTYDDDINVDCGDAISLGVAGSVPVIHMVDNDIIDPDAYYTLLLVDTSDSMVHPILHYGAVNIKGDMLIDDDGLNLMSEDIIDNVFSDYRGPNPPSPSDPWATPGIEKQLFAYEFMLGEQIDVDGSGKSEMIDVPDVSSNMNFDYEDFLKNEVGSGFDNLVSSTYFLSGWCVNDDESNGDDVDDVVVDIMIEDFANPQLFWESYMMDGDRMSDVDGSSMMSNMIDENGNPKYMYNFSNYDNEFKGTDYGDKWNEMMANYGGNNKDGKNHSGSDNHANHWKEDYYDMIAGSSMEVVDGVMILTANITKPSKNETNMWNMMGGSMMGDDDSNGSMMGGGMGSSMVTATAKGKFPDLTSCDGMKFETSMMVDDDEQASQINWDEFEYRIEFGYKKLPEKVFGFGYRANLPMPQMHGGGAKQNDGGAKGWGCYDISAHKCNCDPEDCEEDACTSQEGGPHSWTDQCGTCTCSSSSSSSSSSTDDNAAAAVERSSSIFSEVIIPFEDFSIDWNWRTGEIDTTCEENDEYCPDDVTLKNLETMTITAVGNTNSVPVHLLIKSIMGTGCDDAAAAAAAASMTAGTSNSNNNDDQWTCASSSTASSQDEIIIESMSDPQFNWMTQNDPVMGGESYSSIEMVQEDGVGVAIFSGEVKDVPFLGVPGFIQMESRGGQGTYPDVSCCDALKLTVMSEDEYDGYRVAFGNQRSKSGFFAMGHKADFDAPVGEYGDVVIPFNMFSVEWDEATGDQIITCDEDPTVCPDMETLQNMKTISIWGEGVGGKIELHVKSISAVGCGGGDGDGSGSSSSDNAEPRTNEAIEAWKKENASVQSSSSSITKISSLIGTCAMVAATLIFASI